MSPILFIYFNLDGLLKRLCYWIVKSGWMQFFATYNRLAALLFEEPWILDKRRRGSPCLLSNGPSWPLHEVAAWKGRTGGARGNRKGKQKEEGV
jgi:hypothetical protein